MELLIHFFVTYEAWIYFLAFIAAVFFIRKLILSWRELQSALFGLERETARRKFNSSLSGLILIGIIVTAEFIVVSVITIKYPSLVVLATPTLEIEATSTPEILLMQGTEETQAGTPQAETPQATGTGTGCIAGQLEWIYPLSGDTLKGKVELKGTVNITDLGFYKYEYKAASDASWTTIAGGSLPVVEGPLGGIWQTSELTPGDYQLQLVALDNQNNALPACIIPIVIAAP